MWVAEFIVYFSIFLKIGITYLILLFVFNFKAFYNQNGYFDLVLLVFAMEAMLFTISIAYKYNDLKNKNQNFEKMVIQQSKFVKSGEMIANITHQFRQPLNNISYILMNLKKKFENKNLDEIYFDKKIEGMLKKQIPIEDSCVLSEDDELDEELKYIINDVVSSYGKLSGSSLMNLTHEETPWQISYKSGVKNIVIPKSEIKKFFKELYEIGV
mgnify:CR=1 FL=1